MTKTMDFDTKETHALPEEAPWSFTLDVSTPSVSILPVNHPNLEMEEIGRGSLVCICPYNHPLTRRATLTVKDLLPFPLISYDRASPFGAMVGSLFEAENLPLRAAIEAGSPQNACALVPASEGAVWVGV